MRMPVYAVRFKSSIFSNPSIGSWRIRWAGDTGHFKPFDWYIVFLPNGAAQWKWARKGTPEPLTAYYGEREPGLDYSWQHIIIHPSGALRRWERSRGGVVTWSKEKLPDSDDDHDDAGATDSKHDMDTASPKWEYDTPGEYIYGTDTEDAVSEFDDLVADDAEEEAEARRLKRLGPQLIMDDKGELIWVPKGTSPTSPVQPEDQPIPEPKPDAAYLMMLQTLW
ncbi:hypothetical protein CYMTET_27418 [Cymbomonas tetramitiformis]|uniref:Uncharacterized protein n=1 Tax=Cymbomonas tetramitiformis TaxID=36881 RepID=A0AAE0FPX5_9CHLO|nr:hypothetical protein CYMTET_27418 [Cymbomonas tetramitiformis]